MSARSNIFISYTEEDSKIANYIRDFIRNMNGQISIFIAEKSIFGSDKWRNAIIKALQESGIILPIITYRSIHSSWMIGETGYFWASEKPILPILENKKLLKQAPSFIRESHFIFLEDEDCLERIVTSIFEKLKLGTPPSESIAKYKTKYKILQNIIRSARGPADAVIEWNQALQNGNIAKAYSLTSKDALDYIKSRRDWGGTLEGLSEIYKSTVAGIEIEKNISITGNYAVVEYYCIYLDKPIGENKKLWTDVATREDGEWRILPQFAHEKLA